MKRNPNYILGAAGLVCALSIVQCMQTSGEDDSTFESSEWDGQSKATCSFKQDIQSLVLESFCENAEWPSNLTLRNGQTVAPSWSITKEGFDYYSTLSVSMVPALTLTRGECEWIVGDKGPMNDVSKTNTPLGGIKWLDCFKTTGENSGFSCSGAGFCKIDGDKKPIDKSQSRYYGCIQHNEIHRHDGKKYRCLSGGWSEISSVSNPGTVSDPPVQPSATCDDRYDGSVLKSLPIAQYNAIATVAAESLNLRDSCTINSNTLVQGGLPRGTIVRLKGTFMDTSLSTVDYEPDTGWYLVEVLCSSDTSLIGKIGYVSGDPGYITIGTETYTGQALGYTCPTQSQ